MRGGPGARVPRTCERMERAGGEYMEARMGCGVRFVRGRERAGGRNARGELGCGATNSQGHSRAVSLRRLALALAAHHHNSAPAQTCHHGARAPRAAARGEGKCALGRSEGASRARDRDRRCDKVKGTVRAGGRVAGLAALHQNWWVGGNK